MQGLMVTEGGDEDPVLPGHVQDGGALLGLDGPPVDGQINHKSISIAFYFPGNCF